MSSAPNRASSRPSAGPLPTAIATTLTGIGLAAFFGAGWWLFSAFGTGFFGDNAASTMFQIVGAAFFVTLVLAAVGVVRGSRHAWLAAVTACAAPIGAGVTHLMTYLGYGPPEEALDIFLESLMLVPAVVSAVTIGLLWRRGVRQWCSSDGGVGWLVPAAGFIIASGVGAAVTDYPSNVVMGVGGAVAVLAGPVAFAVTRREAE